MLQRALENVSNDLHVAMAVHGKASTGGNKIFIDNSQHSKAHVAGIVVLIERECVIGVEPAVVEVSPLLSFSNRDHLLLFIRSPLAGFYEDRHQLIQTLCVLFIESGGLRAVEIQHTE